MTVLELSHVTKRFGDFTAVSDVSLTVDKGRILSLLGPSGCGKTTTLRMVSGFEEPNEGSIFIAGQDMKGKRPYERNVGLLFQDYALFPHMTVVQNVGYGLRNRGYEKRRIPARIDEMLELVKLTGLENRRPAQLSGGQQQRVALARALAVSPEVVLLDEPLSALDAKLRQELRVELKEILSAVGATTIVVTHDQEEAMSLADRVVVMERGEICQAGEPTEVYDDPENLFVARFIGSPGMNFAEGEIGGEPPVFTGALDGDGSGRFPVAGGRPGPVTLGIRPEFLRPDPSGPLPAAVVVDELLGRHRNLHLDTPLGRLIMRLGGESAESPEYRPGERLGVALDRGHLRFFDRDTGRRI